ncbi:MAG: DUF981 domain-containing protein [Candidatus Thermoplasmatota archaeon]|nr:DUF981 domain-containing protein [Candidatus Thermoplasmatota archaeon]MCL5730610.1 DUF981 domain-containing protein [Candidatus Thermoplasmatota archaeon]
MLVFVDPLAVMLIGLAMGTMIGAFYFFFDARGDDDQIKALLIPALFVGSFDFLSGFYMSFFWPMTAYGIPYNMLFGDPLTLFGILLVAAAFTKMKGFKFGLLPLMSVVLGIYVLVGAYSIVQLKLETGNDLITAMGLYLFDGIGALLAPILYLNPKNGNNKYLYYTEWIILGIGTVFALIIGYAALNGHLASPP